MRYAGWLTLLFCLVLPPYLAAQLLETRVTLFYSNERLGAILEDITQDYQIRFAYSKYYVPVDRKMSVELEQTPLRTALDTLFTGTAIEYFSMGGQVVLRIGENRQLSQIDLEHRPLQPTEEEQQRRERLGAALPEINREATIERAGELLAALDLDAFRFTEIVSDEPRVEQLPAQDHYHRIAQISIFPFLGTNALMSHKITNQVSINIFWGANGGLDGLELGGLVNTIINDAKGVQVAGIGNTVGDNLVGAQASGFFNLVGGRMEGVQLSSTFNLAGSGEGVQATGLFNAAAGPFEGAQAAGLFNLSGGGRQSWQAAGLFNYSRGAIQTQVAPLFNRADTVSNGQISSLLNIGGRVDGFQLGLVNFADTVAGLPIGLLNFIRQGYNRVEIAGSENLFANIGLKLGVQRFYNILHIGARFSTAPANATQRTESLSWGLGYGIGTAFSLGERWLMNLEGVAIHVNEHEGWTRELNLLNQLRLTADYRLGRRISLFAGPVGNFMVSKLENPETGTIGSNIAPYAWRDQTRGDTNLKIWVGLNAGIRF